ncbi:UNVERIFIED_CONTAM: hypothetical protein PYX00_002368 [Menopon gallinae]|uniref:Alpha-mannosidase n=1 Tax=Menopon gallinae TaxID=328185 RepID=A0AAW2IHG8_9NEOP
MLLSLLLVPLAGMTVIGHPHNLEEIPSGKCGYSSCPKPIPGKLNVHLVPHTHDDVGWLKTVDQYYYGSLSRVQNAGVQYILDSVVRELAHDPNKKFIYVETAFFWKWWLEQGDHMRHLVKKLVANGQLEFIGGAWSMNDEATTHYQSVIDQFTWGLRKLNDTFGYCGQPKIGWQIDPFGHARETASLMAQMGFDGLFFGRLDYQDKRARLLNKTMEMVWEGSASLGVKGDLFTGVLFNHYSTPDGFCWDALCDDSPIIDDPKAPDYNVDDKVRKFIETALFQSKYFVSRDIMLTFGDDFHFQNAHRNFKNIDKLIRYVNERQKNGSDVNVFYSTPSCYVKSLNDANIYWPTKKDDFFPYASDQHSYWTGYFSSRPTLKYFERLGNNYLQICKQLASLAHLGPDYDHDLTAMREAMGIMQHHDAITGTEKQHVANDYARILTEGFGKCGALVDEALNRILKAEEKSPRLELKSCLLSNISECAVASESKNFIMTIYNPLSRPVNYYARVPAYNGSYSVRDPKGNRIQHQLVPIPDPLKALPGRKSETDFEIVFKAEAIPPLGYRSYYVSRLNGSDEAENSTDEEAFDEVEDYLTDGEVLLVKGNNDTLRLNLTVHYYIGEVGNNAKPEHRSSGAYIFRPKGTEPRELKFTGKGLAVRGKVVNEVHQVFSDWASHVVRQYKGENYIEVEWLAGPIPIQDSTGKEMIWRYDSELESNGTFFTDSSGRETLERIKDYRPTWDVNLLEPVAGNYYPVTTEMSISDGETELTVLTDRAQGGTSMNSGQMELMVHRRLLHDDAFGVGEALNEVAYGSGLVARGHHWILAGDKSDPGWPVKKRQLQQQKILNSHVLYTNADSITFEEWTKSHRLEFSGLKRALPPNVQILTLEPWKASSFLLRLEHIFEKSESSDEANIDLNDLFVTFDIISIRETTLGANQWLDEASRLVWKKETNEISDVPDEGSRNVRNTSLKIKLRPKEIRTFICQVKPKPLV